MKCLLCIWDPFTAVFLNGQLFFCCWRDWFKDQWKVNSMGRAVKQDTAPKKTVPSRQWSCSELQDGHAKLLEIKSEKLSPDEMQKQIDEAYHNNMCRVFFGIFWCNPNSFTYINSKDAGKIEAHKHKHIMCSAPLSGLWTSTGCFEERLIGHVFEWALSIRPWGEDGLGLFPFHIFHHTSLPQNPPTHFEILRSKSPFINPTGLWVSVHRVG